MERQFDEPHKKLNEVAEKIEKSMRSRLMPTINVLELSINVIVVDKLPVSEFNLEVLVSSRRSFRRAEATVKLV